MSICYQYFWETRNIEINNNKIVLLFKYNYEYKINFRAKPIYEIYRTRYDKL